MIPEEDRGPAWLRDYGYTDFGDIEADLVAMEEFAKKLASVFSGLLAFLAIRRQNSTATQR
jgi:hypothetical protein